MVAGFGECGVSVGAEEHRVGAIHPDQAQLAQALSDGIRVLANVGGKRLDGIIGALADAPNAGGGWNAANPNDWVLVGSARFEGLNDRDSGATGWAGRGVTALGFKAVDGDAVCAQANVRFANNTMRQYPINNRQPMTRDRLYQIDMPGDRQTVTAGGLRCHALGKYSVTINMYGNK